MVGGNRTGIFVSHVRAGSPAEQCGLKEGSELLEVCVCVCVFVCVWPPPFLRSFLLMRLRAIMLYFSCCCSVAAGSVWRWECDAEPVHR